jgi:hypothetical protein
MRWWFAFVIPATTPIPPTSSPSCDSNSNFIKLEVSLDPPGILLVPRSHISTVHLDHVRFEIKSRSENDKFLSLALGLSAGVVSMREMPFLIAMHEFYSSHGNFNVG